jgi:trehalose 6-phosphate phosphatase
MAMKHLLSPRNLPVVERFAWSRVLLAFDFDGTLAPIIVDPNAAQMRARTRVLLARAATLYPTVVISGRTRADTRRRLEGVALREVIGNHGAERTDVDAREGPAVRRWRLALGARLAELPGVFIESKGLSLSVHYRQSRQKKRARAAILAGAAELARREPLRIVGGKQVVNLVSEDAPHKGVALERARARLGCDTALYVGDDETDEDVFALDQPGRLLGVRVGTRAGSHAAFFLRGQGEIDQLLRVLIRARTAEARGAA